MKALVGAFNQEKALVGAFSVIVQPVVEPMDRFAALLLTAAACNNQTPEIKFLPALAVSPSHLPLVAGGPILLLVSFK